MNRINRENFNIISEGRVIGFLSSLLLCLFLAACGEKNVVFIEPQETMNSERQLPDIEEAENEQFNENGVNIDETEAEKPKCVYVCGAVLNEIVYTYTEEKRVVDAIEAAGGFTDDACKTAINLSSKLVDEQKVYVPTYSEVKDTIWSENGNKEQNDSRININSADITQLITLKGIGETRAQAIIEYREKNGGFKSIEDIMNVSGIGQSSFDKIKDMIRVE